MYRMMGFIIPGLVLLSCCVPLHAQNGSSQSWFIGASLEFQIPTGDLSSVTGTGFGGMVRLGYMTGPDVMLTAGVGYSRMGGGGFNIPFINVSVPKPGVTIIPIVGGIRYLIGSGTETRAFAGGEAGLYLLSGSLNIAGFSASTENIAGWGISPIAGVLFSGSSRVAGDVYAKYTYLIQSELGELSPRWMTLSGGAMVNLSR